MVARPRRQALSSLDGTIVILPAETAGISLAWAKATVGHAKQTSARTLRSVDARTELRIAHMPTPLRSARFSEHATAKRAGAMDATGADGTRTGTVATPPTERWSPNGSPS